MKTAFSDAQWGLTTAIYVNTAKNLFKKHPAIFYDLLERAKTIAKAAGRHRKGTTTDSFETNEMIPAELPDDFEDSAFEDSGDERKQVAHPKEEHKNPAMNAQAEGEGNICDEESTTEEGGETGSDEDDGDDTGHDQGSDSSSEGSESSSENSTDSSGAGVEF